jgi:hypothetical protein
VDFDRANYAKAKLAFERYKALVDRLTAINPGKPEWLKEAAYAYGNLCTIALKPPVHPDNALKFCSAALARMEAAADVLGDRPLSDELQNRHGWMADAWKANGNPTKARQERSVQELILRKMRADEPDNLAVREIWILFQIAMADLYLLDHNPSWSPRQLDEASAELDVMIALDPQNKSLLQRRLDLRKRVRRIRLIKTGRRPAV